VLFHWTERASTIAVRDRDSANLIEVRVIPRDSRPRVEKMEDGTFRVYLKAVPEKGRANSELLALMAGYLGVSRSDIAIIRGSRSRKKLLRVKAGY
jgi:uncharacterized protein YggU (UPF0235/DUF167 family)